MGIADNLKRLREAAGLSQLRLAKKSGVSQQLISQIENGKNTSTKALPALAAAIGCKVYDIDPSYAEGTGSGRAVPLASIDLLARVAREGLTAVPEDLERVSVGGLGEGEWIALRTMDDALDLIAPEGALLIANLADTAMEDRRFYLFYDEEQGTVFYRWFIHGHLETYSSRPRFGPISLRKSLRPLARISMAITHL
tara:strand:+ start:455 stop:1045 length:591 start_codon:yes stop_codon:yes gene_type:complete